MNEILAKISSYNIFNYLIPGAVFSMIAQNLNLLTVPQELAMQLIWFYFVGLTLSRIGSIFLEPILRKIKFVSYTNYSQFLKAERDDDKLEVMVETANTYRTLATCFLILILASIFESIKFNGERPSFEMLILLVGLLFVFLLSFQKQTKFVSARVRESQERIHNG